MRTALEIDPVGHTQIAERLGIPDNTVQVWRRRYESFPPPRWVLSGGMVWDWPDVLEWLWASGRLDLKRGPRHRDGDPLGNRLPYETRSREVAALVDRDGSDCHYCGTHLKTSSDVDAELRPTVDHVVPVARGGSEGLANKVLACKPCNSRKGTKSYEEFTGSLWLAPTEEAP